MSKVVISIVIVIARPYAASMFDESRKYKITKQQAKKRNQFIMAIYI
jgi:hypothetical protein